MQTHPLSWGLRRSTLGLLGLLGLWGLQWGHSLRSPLVCLWEGASRAQTGIKPKVLLLSLGLTAMKNVENIRDLPLYPMKAYCIHCTKKNQRPFPKITRPFLIMIISWSRNCEKRSRNYDFGISKSRDLWSVQCANNSLCSDNLGTIPVA